MDNLYPLICDIFNCSETQNCHQNLEMILLKKLKGINPMGLSFPLVDSYNNNRYETPDCHKNLDIIGLKNFKGLNQWALVPLWITLKPTIILKHFTVTKTLRWFPWSQSINWLWKLQPHNQNPRHDLPKNCGVRKYVCPVWIRPTYNVQSQPRKSFRINKSWSIKFNKHK